MSEDRAAPDIDYQELLAMTPPRLRAALPDIRWRLERLWALDLPVTEIATSQLVWMFELPLWQLDGKRFQVAPAEVLADPAACPAHYQRILDADLNQPIHLLTYRRRLVVLDGIHRLAKATIENRTTIPAKRLTIALLESTADEG